MKIDLETAKYYSGLGDLVMWAWLAEGAKNGPLPLVFHRRRDLILTELLGVTTDPEPGGLKVDNVFPIEVADHGRLPRLEYLRRHLELQTPFVRPTLRLAPDDETWAKQTASDIGSPLVLLFPQTAWKAREWPANYWVDLAWKFKERGFKVVLLYQGEDARFQNTPLFYWNMPIPRLAALMKHAALVIGNDSFPAHLAGTVGVPTIALMGPTRGSVFAHIPNVTAIASSMDCTGCHFQPPFRAACDQGCMSLYRLFPDDVLKFALHLLAS
jgi:ADP-heptose:LPS heptosyltransferase